MKAKQKPSAIAASVGSLVDTDTLAQITAGSIDFIRTKDGEVRGLALNPKLNPEAPRIVIVGKGIQKEKRAQLLVEVAYAVPTYVKQRTNAWEYRGEFKATDYSTDKAVIEKYRHHRLASKVAGILFLEPATDVSISVSGGGFASPETRKAVETAAINFVTEALTQDGFKVHDHQKKNLGYDLMAVSDRQTLFVEVKGTDSLIPRFFITRGERRRSSDADWRLAIVTNARSKPNLLMLTGAEAKRQFEFEALAWECTLKPEV